MKVLPQYLRDQYEKKKEEDKRILQLKLAREFVHGIYAPQSVGSIMTNG